MKGLDLVWESATPPTHIWERSPKKKGFFWHLPLSSVKIENVQEQAEAEAVGVSVGRAMSLMRSKIMLLGEHAAADDGAVVGDGEEEEEGVSLGNS